MKRRSFLHSLLGIAAAPALAPLQSVPKSRIASGTIPPVRIANRITVYGAGDILATAIHTESIKRNGVLCRCVIARTIQTEEEAMNYALAELSRRAGCF